MTVKACTMSNAVAASPDVSHQPLRAALGCFATGVTVITTNTPEGRAIGLTANSFTSVSLEPPLILWSLQKSSANLENFRRASHFAVNVLSSQQKELCYRFARKGDGDRFEGLALAPSPLDLPLLADSLAHFECARQDEYEAGDHVMFLGRIERFCQGQGDALIYSGGQLLAAAALAT